VDALPAGLTVGADDARAGAALARDASVARRAAEARRAGAGRLRDGDTARGAVALRGRARDDGEEECRDEEASGAHAGAPTLG
jgi:hypothetical protein